MNWNIIFQNIWAVSERTHMQAWIVGGFLRDRFLKRDLDDLDIAIQGNPENFADQVAQTFNAKFFPLDSERGIYRVICKHSEKQFTIDIAALRAVDIDGDLLDRDFSINAMALPIKQAHQRKSVRFLIDPTNGLRDLEEKTVRVLNQKTFSADPLRLIRAYRIAAQLNMSIEKATRKLVSKNAPRIKRVSPERVREEMLRIMNTGRTTWALKTMEEDRLLRAILPEIEAMKRCAIRYYGKGGVWKHSLNTVASFEWLQAKWRHLFPRFHRQINNYLQDSIGGFARAAHLKLACLIHDVAKPKCAKMIKGRLRFFRHDEVGEKMAGVIANRLRLSTAEGKSLQHLVRAHMRPGNLAHQPFLSDKAIYRFFRDLQEDGVAMLLVALADHFTYLKEKERIGKKDIVYLTIRKMLRQYYFAHEKVTPPKVLDGHTIMKELKIKPGPIIGKIISAVQEAQASGSIKSTDEAKTWIRDRYQSLAAQENRS